MGITNDGRDEIMEPLWGNKYKVILDSDGTDNCQGLRCFTDGSKSESGAGAGICIAAGSYIYRTRAFGLPQYSTIAQAEMRAIGHACKQLKEVLDANPDLGNYF